MTDTHTALAIVPYSDLEKMGNAIAASGLFGITKPEQAIALMLIAQSEGLHPAIAARDYHIIQGRPALKADAMLGRFQRAGGSVEWKDYTDEKVSATFSHPQGGTVVVEWDMARAKQAGLGTKDNWIKYRRQMLRARVISEGVRTVFPGCIGGFYTQEEVQDMPPQRVEKVITGEVVEAADASETAAAPKKGRGVSAMKQKLEGTATEGTPVKIAIEPDQVKMLKDFCANNDIAVERLLKKAGVAKVEEIEAGALGRCIAWLDTVATAQVAAKKAEETLAQEGQL